MLPANYRRLAASRRIIAGSALCACVAAISAAPSPAREQASVTTGLRYDSRVVVKPSTVDSRKVLTKNGGQPFDETVYRARHLRWSGWGNQRAVAHGSITFCVIGYKRCRTRAGTVVLRGMHQYRCGDMTIREYKTLQWRSRARAVPDSAVIPLYFETDC
jgi:hypothetical protein